MELMPRNRNLSTGKGGYQDANAALARDLTPLEQITGRKIAPQLIKGAFLSLDIDRSNLLAVCRFLRDQLNFDMLSCISGVDMVDHLEAVYHVRSIARNQILQLKVQIDASKPEVDSVVSVWLGANWLEREIYDLYGVRFLGHPDLRRILLDDGFDGYPMLKSFHQVPFTVKPPATTQVNPNIAVAGNYQLQDYEHVVMKKLGQGMEERLHPGTPTFSHTTEEIQKHANTHASNQPGQSVTGKSQENGKESKG
jgi:NADH/F420H2 dehydrogenase subunit C